MSVDALPLWGLVALFAGAAALVWLAGSRLTGKVDGIARATGMGQAFAGMLLLGGITSLPEVAAVSASAVGGNGQLAVNNLLGTASINLLLLALADVLFGREALTGVAAKPAVLMQGVLAMLLAAAVVIVVAAGDVAVFGLPFNLGALMLAVAAVGALWLSSAYQDRHVWQVVGGAHEDEPESDEDTPALPGLILSATLLGLAILGSGYLLSVTAEQISERTGASTGLVGFLLVGLATSLPEVSSVTAAVRQRRYQLAIGDIFGTNIFNIMLILLADGLASGGPVLAAAGRFEMVGAGLTVMMSGIFVVGLLERDDRTVLRMGYDSVAALLAFGTGVALLARLA